MVTKLASQPRWSRLESFARVESSQLRRTGSTEKGKGEGSFHKSLSKVGG